MVGIVVGFVKLTLFEWLWFVLGFLSIFFVVWLLLELDEKRKRRKKKR